MFVMYENKKELLSKLEFGNVDSESELDLDRKFIKTKDFEQFINPQKSLVLGAKGSGKRRNIRTYGWVGTPRR